MSESDVPETGDDAIDDTAAAPDVELRHGVPVVDSYGTAVLYPEAETYVETIEALRADGFAMLIDLTAVDYLSYDAPRTAPAAVVVERFEVVSSYINHSTGERLRVVLQVADGASVPTLFDSFPGSEAMEREVTDMFGISFENHPDPSRILMPEDWVGHPLRKDYAVGRIPVQFKATSNR